MNTISSNVNFQAKMKLDVSCDEQKWKEIARIFAEETKNYPKDIFYITGSFDEGISIATKIHKQKFRTDFCGQIVNELTNKLKGMKDSEIAETLKTIFLTQRKAVKMTIAEENYLKKNKVPENVVLTFENNVRGSALESLIERGLKRNKFLYDNKESIYIYTPSY